MQSSWVTRWWKKADLVGAFLLLKKKSEVAKPIEKQPLVCLNEGRKHVRYIDLQAPLPDDQYTLAEKAVIWVAIGLGLVMLAGLMLAFDTVWTETLKPIIWDPVVKDAGVAGDAGYPQNTAIYTLSMLACVVLFQALFRSWNLPSDERMTLARSLGFVLLQCFGSWKTPTFSHPRGMCCSSLRSSISTWQHGWWALRH